MLEKIEAMVNEHRKYHHQTIEWEKALDQDLAKIRFSKLQSKANMNIVDEGSHPNETKSRDTLKKWSLPLLEVGAYTQRYNLDQSKFEPPMESL